MLSARVTSGVAPKGDENMSSTTHPMQQQNADWTADVQPSDLPDDGPGQRAVLVDFDQTNGLVEGISPDRDRDEADAS